MISHSILNTSGKTRHTVSSIHLMIQLRLISMWHIQRQNTSKKSISLTKWFLLSNKRVMKAWDIMKETMVKNHLLRGIKSLAVKLILTMCCRSCSLFLVAFPSWCISLVPRKHIWTWFLRMVVRSQILWSASLTKSVWYLSFASSTKVLKINNNSCPTQSTIIQVKYSR